MDTVNSLLHKIADQTGVKAVTCAVRTDEGVSTFADGAAPDLIFALA